MEKDFNLYTHIIKMVEQQIETNTPPAAGETYKRLMDKGDDSETAKEKIASIIAEELYMMMGSEDKQLNQERYAEKLSQIE